MEQNKLMSKPLKQTSHITDIKNNIIGIPFITKYIPTVNILNSRIHIKDNYTTMKITPYFKPTFQLSKYMEKPQMFLTRFNFQQSQIT